MTKTMKIEFKTKVQTMRTVDDAPLYDYVEVPVFKRSHVDMAAARNHPKYGGYANSDLFLGMLARIRRDVLSGRAFLRLSELPDNVTVDASGFLARVTVQV
jgi:hypothetical protein